MVKMATDPIAVRVKIASAYAGMGYSGDMINLIKLHQSDDDFITSMRGELKQAIRFQNKTKISLFKEHMDVLFSDPSMGCIEECIQRDDLEVFKLFNLGDSLRPYLELTLESRSSLILQYLIEMGMDISEPISEDCVPSLTPLMLASKMSDYEGAKILLAMGADPNAHNTEALRISSKYDSSFSLRVTELLLISGANPNPEPSLAPHVGSRLDLNSDMTRPLILAILSGSYSKVKLLIDYGANVEYQDDLALLIAYNKKQLDMVDLLLIHGGSFENLKDKILISAIEFRDDSMIKQMIDLGANIDRNVLSTALICKSDIEVIKLLHEKMLYCDSAMRGGLLLRAIFYKNDLDVLIYLTESGILVADHKCIILQCIDSDSYTFLEYFIGNGIGSDSFPAISIGYMAKASLEIIKIAYSQGIPTSSDDIEKFVFAGNYPVVKYLVEDLCIILNTSHSESDSLMLSALKSGCLDMICYVASMVPNFSHEKAFHSYALLSRSIGFNNEIAEYLVSHIPDISKIYIGNEIRTSVNAFLIKRMHKINLRISFEIDNEKLIKEISEPIHIISELIYERCTNAVDFLFRIGLDPRINGNLPLIISTKYGLTFVKNMINHELAQRVSKCHMKKLIN